MDGRRMPAYAISSPMSLWLSWAKNHILSVLCVTSDKNELSHRIWTYPAHIGRTKRRGMYASKLTCSSMSQGEIRAVAGQGSLPELCFANKTKMFFRAKKKRRKITGLWNIEYCDVNLFWVQRPYNTDSFSKSMTFIYQIKQNHWNVKK